LSARAGKFEAEAAMLEAPIVSWVYRALFAPETYFRLDSMVMFRTAVQRAVEEAVGEVTQAKGLRSLGASEPVPAMAELVEAST
jgi:hypothetical protein